MASRQCRGLDPAMVIGPTSYMMVIAPCCEPSAPRCVEPARQRCCSLPYRFCMHQQLRRGMHAAVHGWMPEDAQPNPDTPSWLLPSINHCAHPAHSSAHHTRHSHPHASHRILPCATPLPVPQCSASHAPPVSHVPCSHPYHMAALAILPDSP